MEKLKLANGQVLNLIPNWGRETEKTREFKFTSDQDINTLLELLSNQDNFASVQIISPSGDTLKIYQDITSFAGIFLDKDVQTDDKTVSDVYTVRYRTDLTAREIQQLKDTVDALVLASLEGGK
jgi:hypothetical protein